jgi:hypothetical protein
MRGLSSVLLALVALAGPAAAQESRSIELFGAYSYTRSGEADEKESFHGWNGSLTFPLTSALGLEGDVSGHSATVEGSDLRLTGFMAGPRWAFRRGGVTPYVHALAGVVRSSASLAIGSVTISESQTDFGGLVGAGVDVRLKGRLGLRVQADYRLVKGEEETAKDPRVSVGLSLRLGRE